MRPVFLLFGDSITQRGWAPGGWAARLADSYGRRADILNRGYSGYNTAKAVQLLPFVFPEAARDAPSLVTVFLGANDAALSSVHPGHHVSLADYEANLRIIVSHIRRVHGAAASAARPAIMLITPPPVDEAARVRANSERHGTPADAPPERTCEVTAGYAAACSRVAREMGCALVDAFSGFQADAGWRETHLNDGLHFAPAGDEALFRLVTAAIEEQLPELAVRSLPYDFPEWSEFVDGKLPVRPAESCRAE